MSAQAANLSAPTQQAGVLVNQHCGSCPSGSTANQTVATVASLAPTSLAVTQKSWSQSISENWGVGVAGVAAVTVLAHQSDLLPQSVVDAGQGVVDVLTSPTNPVTYLSTSTMGPYLSSVRQMLTNSSATPLLHATQNMASTALHRLGSYMKSSDQNFLEGSSHLACAALAVHVGLPYLFSGTSSVMTGMSQLTQLDVQNGTKNIFKGVVQLGVAVGAGCIVAGSMQQLVTDVNSHSSTNPEDHTYLVRQNKIMQAQIQCFETRTPLIGSDCSENTIIAQLIKQKLL